MYTDNTIMTVPAKAAIFTFFFQCIHLTYLTQRYLRVFREKLWLSSKFTKSTGLLSTQMYTNNTIITSPAKLLSVEFLFSTFYLIHPCAWFGTLSCINFRYLLRKRFLIFWSTCYEPCVFRGAQLLLPRGLGPLDMYPVILEILLNCNLTSSQGQGHVFSSRPAYSTVLGSYSYISAPIYLLCTKWWVLYCDEHSLTFSITSLLFSPFNSFYKDTARQS